VDGTSPEWRSYVNYRSPFDPCSARVKWYDVPPEVMHPVQKSARKQFAPQEALRKGTLWPEYDSPYPPT